VWYCFEVKKYIFILVIVVLSGYAYLQNPYKAIAPSKTKEDIAKEEYAKRVEEEKPYLLGHFSPVNDANFTLVPTAYLTYNTQMYLRKETLEAFIAMQEEASKSGVSLKLASGARNFDHQKRIWENKWDGTTLVDGKDLSKSIPDGVERFLKILEYSAAPSTSRHHWGTDIDINGATPSYFETTEGKKVYDWLTANAMNYGFCQTYDEKGLNRTAGYKEEKWHWSYLPIARGLTQDFKAIIRVEDIKGFKGDEYVEELNLIDNYVLSINPECL